jgi:DNA repair exonuclease SbcCD ATPase subunit
VKQFIERYGATRNAALFLEELLNLCFPKPSHDQITNWASLDHETLRQTAEQLWKDQESLRITKLELENKVSDLSRTKENREVKKLKEEKVDLQQEKEHLKSQVAQLQKKLENLQQQLSSQQTQNNHHYQDYKRNYQELVIQWNKLTQDYAVLQKRLIGTHTIEQENEKLKKSRQTLENRVQEIEQELRETQQKLSLATTRLRGVNTHSELGGGGSRSDQLKKEFSLLKPTIREVSTRILTGWQSQGFKSSASNDFKSEEFLKIRSILSQRVFGDGMVYFAKDKTEVDNNFN